MRKRRLLWGLSWLVILVIAIVVMRVVRTPKQAVETTLQIPVRIAMPVTPLTVPFLIAQAKGYFAACGLGNVSTTPYTSGKHSLQAVFEGKADIATVADIPIVLHSFKRDDYAVLFTFASSENDVKIISRRDMALYAAADLQGRKVAITAGTSSHFFLESFLVYHGVDPHTVDMTHIPPEDMTQALETGAVDAVTIWEPHAFKTLQVLGANAIVLQPPRVLYTETFNAVALKSYMSAHPDIGKRLVQAIDMAIQYIYQQQHEAQATVSRLFPAYTTFIPAVWDDFHYELRLEQGLILTLEHEARWAMRHGLTEQHTMPNYLQYLAVEALKAVKPEAVRLLQ